jgi:two-component system chemotaxis sensor kinase CheA
MSDELDEIQAIFFEECAEGLTTAEQGLSQMAAGETSPEIIAGVFRAVHSIKGGSGAFGHAALLAFSHRFENVLDEVRAGRIPATAEVTRVMLTAFDVLSDHVAAAKEIGGAPNDASALVALDALLASKGDAAASSLAVAVSEEEADDFGFTPVAATFDDFDPFGFEPIVAVLEELHAPAPWRVRFAPSCAAMANGAEPLLVIRELESLGGTVEAADCSRLLNLRDLDPEAAYLSWTLRVPGTVEEGDLLECFDFVDPASVVEIARELPERVAMPAMSVAGAGADEVALQPSLDTPPPAAQECPPPAAATGKAEKPADVSSAPQTIRVELSKLDLLLNLVGELVIRNSILSDRLSPKDQERAELPELARLTRQIQDNVMSLRAQPIRQAFSRVPRMLRDLCAETGKQILLETSGEGTEIDKGVIEKIGDPLTHMIRNAADHGIEDPDERAAKGKPREGTIRLSAEQKGARILVRVADDGRGIDRGRVRAKAIEKGIIQSDAQLTDEETDQLICAPGFSTAEVISNISGRGVGMDVVRSNVEALGGRVEISSTPGEGTTFTMILPLTLAILDGMIVRLSGQRLVLPLANVIEAVRPEPGQIRPMTPTSEVIELRGNYLPIRRLSETFCKEANDRRAPEDSLVIVVESESAGHVGLLVDSIDGRREVVIKSLDQNLHPIRGLSGATILGDGSIALILDVEALVADTPVTPRHPAQGLAA